MKADSCVSFTDTGDRGLANGLTEPEKQDGKYGFLLPAGAMIGLGVGFLVGHAGSGVLVGVGVGLLASGLIPLIKRPLEDQRLQREDTNTMVLLIGALLIFIGISLVMAPAVLWPYAIPGLMILFGILTLVRGFYKIS